MAQRRNHYGDGFHASGGGGYSGYDAGYSAGPAQHAFPSYSPKSGGIKGNKGKRNMPGAAGVLAVALVVSVLVMLYLFSRGNTLATKLETVEQDAKQLRKKLSKAEMDYKSADKLRMYNEERSAQLDKVEQKLRDERTTSSSYQRKAQELTEQLEALKATNKELTKQLNDAQSMHADKEEEAKALEGERERSKRMQDFWNAKEEEWAQNKKILELDLELAKANIDRLEKQLKKERDAAQLVRPEKVEAKEATQETDSAKAPVGGVEAPKVSADEPKDPVDPEFKAADAEPAEPLAEKAGADEVQQEIAEIEAEEKAETGPEEGMQAAEDGEVA